MCIQMCVSLYVYMCIDMCIDMFLDVCIDMCIDMLIDMCIDLCIHMCIDMCIDLCTDMCADMCIDMLILGFVLAACTPTHTTHTHARLPTCTHARTHARTHSHIDTLDVIETDIVEVDVLCAVRFELGSRSDVAASARPSPRRWLLQAARQPVTHRPPPSRPCAMRKPLVQKMTVFLNS